MSTRFFFSKFSRSHLTYTSIATSIVIGLVAGLAGCSGPDDDDFAKMPVEELYMMAKAQLDNGSYNSAAKTFAEVERQHPYSEWSLRAQLMSAYSYYEAKKYIEAVEAFKAFIQLHPGHENIDYAYYMVGFCYYEQIPTIHRDQEATERALEAFEEVIRRFPGSPYAKDAKYKIDFVRDHLAGKEMEVGRYYLKQKAYLAAVNRFKVVVDKYQTSSHTPEALHRLVESYLALGIPEQALASASVLGHNFPGSPWYVDSYNLMKAKDPKATLPAKEASTPSKNPKPVTEDGAKTAAKPPVK